MHGINQSYAQYFNHLHHRSGHVFFDRFKSKLVQSNPYLLTVSGYIHKNPKDIKKYRNSIEDYKYSSLGIYLGLREDTYNLVDEDYIMQIFSHKVQL